MHSEDKRFCEFFIRGKCRFEHHCKNSHEVVNCVVLRHAQSTYNQVCEEVNQSLDIFSEEAKQVFQMQKKYIDSPLSAKGIEQVKHMSFPPYLYTMQQTIFFQYILVSPLERTLMTTDYLIKSHPIQYRKVIVLPILTEVFSKICDISSPLEQKMQKYPNFDFSELEKIDKKYRWQDQLVDDQYKDRIIHGKKDSQRYLKLLDEEFPQPLESGRNCFQRSIYALLYIKQLIFREGMRTVLIVSHNRILKYFMGKETRGKADSFKNCELRALSF